MRYIGNPRQSVLKSCLESLIRGFPSHIEGSDESKRLRVVMRKLDRKSMKVESGAKRRAYQLGEPSLILVMSLDQKKSHLVDRSTRDIGQ